VSFASLPFVAVLGGLAALAGGLYLLQRLRVRHREVVVPTTLFWKAAVQETRARVLVARFRHPLAYALVLLIASLIWLAFAGPVVRPARDAMATVFLLDGSAGMAWGDRFARARETLLEQVGRLPDGEAQVIFCGGWPRTLLRRGEHPILLERRSADLSPEACPASLERASADALPQGWKLLRPGRDSERPANGGVLALGISEARSGAWDRVDVHVDAPDGYSINLETLRDVPARGQEIVVRLPGGDAIAADDEARLVLPSRTLLRVKRVPELADVLRLDSGVELGDDGVEIELTDGATIVIEGPADALATAPGALLEFVDAERGEESPRVERRVAAKRRVLLGRELLGEHFNFTRTRAFPLFVAGAVRWLANSAEFAPFVAAGERIPGSEFVPPTAGSYDGQIASLLDPLERTDAARDEGLRGSGGGGDAATWLGMLAFALLLAEWFFHRTGRMP